MTDIVCMFVTTTIPSTHIVVYRNIYESVSKVVREHVWKYTYNNTIAYINGYNKHRKCR